MQGLECIEAFKKRMKRYVGYDLELVFNENRSTMLNILEKRRNYARLSIHKMFLEAPDSVLSAIAHYVLGRRKERQILRDYIQKNLSLCPQEPIHHSLVHQGAHYNLKPIYDAINEQYFNNELKLAITWYGRGPGKGRTRATFGKYLPGMRLVKIHKRLDNPFFPDYFVSFVVYHEMLHSVVGGFADKRGRYCFHGLEFKQKERAFAHYCQAVAWEKNNIKQILEYGWT